MDKLKKEVLIEGWLTKSPPRKKFEKIWRSRWRRRWFALKQGELPGQFFLEYYTDSSCRKLKGQIDLDQCEQVDAGLRMLDKFQHMFDVKTPARTYYLAADSEEDMRSWVKCICQVCGLQETTRMGTPSDAQYLNIGPDAINEVPLHSNISLLSNDTNTTLLPNTPVLNNNPDITPSPRFPELSSSMHQNNYQNTDFNNSFRGSDYCNRATILCEAKLHNNISPPPFNNNNSINNAEAYTNFSTIERNTIERSQSLKAKDRGGIIGHHSRTQSLNETPPAKPPRKVPSKLKLGTVPNLMDADHKMSPVLCGSSGPYIAISECYSGTAAFRRFEASQQYSPKSIGHNTSDNESVFTDDEWQHPVPPQHTLNRTNRQSETSLDDNLPWSYMTRFSKVPADPPPRPPKRIGGSAELPPSSPTGMGGGVGATALTNQQHYNAGDIPNATTSKYSRSQQMISRQTSAFEQNSPSFSPLDIKQVIASSTPNLIANDAQSQIGSSRTLPHTKQNFYTNTPTTMKTEGTIFRYDFIEQTEAPAVNRKLKPKTISESSTTILGTSMNHGNTTQSVFKPPPNVNRSLKPATSKTGIGEFNNTLQNKRGPRPLMNITLPDEHLLASLHDDTLPKTPKSSEDRLQYLDLDHSHVPVTKGTPPKPGLGTNNNGSVSVSNLSAAPRPNGDLPSVAYTTVDFVKTDAFNRIRADSAKQRHIRPK